MPWTGHDPLSFATNRMAQQALQGAQARLDQLQRQCDEAFMAYEANPSNDLKKERYTELKLSLHKAEDVVKSLATAAGAAAATGSPNLSRALFTEMLKSGNISRPHAEILDTVERYYTHRMMACSSVQMAEEIYRAAQSMPGASTTKYFLAQHGLQINGPFFRAPDTGPVTLLKARNANYEQKMIKMLPNLPSNLLLGGSEAIACRAILPSAERHNIPIIRGKVIEVIVPPEHHTLTGHCPGLYAAVVMPQYLGSIEMQMAAAEPELLKGMNQMIQAVEHVHAEGFVHMDVKADNFFVGSDGNWWLGDFGSAVKFSEPITSTTELFNPQKFLLGTPALPTYDWYMLAAALIKEVLKHKGEEAWKAALIENGCTPQHKLLAASGHVKHPQLQLALQEILRRSECV